MYRSKILELPDLQENNGKVFHKRREDGNAKGDEMMLLSGASIFQVLSGCARLRVLAYKLLEVKALQQRSH